MTGLNLINKRGFAWYSIGACHVKGSFFDAEGRLYQGEEVLNYFKDVDSPLEFRKKMQGMNGVFSVVLAIEGAVYLAVDTIRSFPLFYIKKGKEWLVSDNAWFLKEQMNNPQISSLSRLEFRSTGFVSGDETLISGLNQLQAGEIVVLDSECTKNYYFSYRVKNVREASYGEHKREGIRYFEQAFQRLVEGIAGRTALVPLSGGYDSRLIAVMLKKLGHKNVICFSYGRKDNPEALVSRQVAKVLGFQWIFVEYDEETIGAYLESATFQDYYKWGSNLSSMFYFQEYFAVKYMKEKNLIPDDSVFIPGHSGDFLGGSQFFKHGFSSHHESMDEMIDRIFRVKYLYDEYNATETKILKDKIKLTLLEKGKDPDDLSYSVHEDWDFKEKLAKFNFNSNSIYTFWNYEFRIPYWDLDLIRFFQHLPVEEKVSKKLYDDILRNNYFESYGLNFTEELQPSPSGILKQRAKDRMKKYIPGFIKNRLVKRRDNICYYEITSMLREDMLKKGRVVKYNGNKYNRFIIEWFLNELEREVTM